MADQQSTHASLTSAVNTYYSKKALKSFEPKTKWYAAAPMKEPIPEGSGNAVQFTRYNKIAYLRGNDTDQFTAQQMYLSAETVSATLHERDGYVQLSRTAVLVSINRILDKAMEKVSTAGAKTLDILIRNDIGMMVADVAAGSSLAYDNMAIDGGTLNSTGITARVWSHNTAAAGDRFPMYHDKTRLAQSATVVSFAKSGMTIKTLQHGVKVLQGLDVDKINGVYKMITHPDMAYQITTNAGFKGWIAPTDANPAYKDPTIHGVVAGVQIETTTLALRFPLSGDTLSTSSGALYCSLLFGDEAYGCAEISGYAGKRGFNMFLKQSGPQTTSDPTNKKKQAAFSVYSVGKVINKSAGLWILTTEQV